MGSSGLLKEAEGVCSGMLEECTLDYTKCVKARFGGIWVCRLRAEAVKDEQARLALEIEAALMVHAKFREIGSGEPAIDNAQSLLKRLKKIISASNTSHL